MTVTPTLYKYVSSVDAVVNLARGRLKFTPIGELNDPSEMLPVMNAAAFRQSLFDIRRQGFSAEQFEWLRYQGAVLAKLAPDMQAVAMPTEKAMASKLIHSPFYDDVERMHDRYRRTVDVIRQKVGVFCLSSRFDSLPMWAHYAALAGGFIVSFIGLEQVFGGDQTGSLNSVKPVSYVDAYEGITFDPVTQDRLFFSKLTDWGYEREWRVVCALEDCDLMSSALYLRQIDAAHIGQVICGWKANDDDIRRLDDAGLSTKMVFADIDDGRVTFRNRRGF